MARDTRGPVPVGTTDLRRVSLEPGHWRQARWMLAAEAVVLLVVGGAGLVDTLLVAPHGSGLAFGGVDLSTALSVTLVGLGVCAVPAAIFRRFALVFTAAIGVVGLGLMIVCAVAATHYDPGPLRFSAASMLLYAALFVYNFAVGVWLVPDHIEGPAWLPRRTRPDQPGRDA